MNNPHKNARTTPLGRAEMIRRIVEEGRPTAEVAAGFGISERTARKWVARWRAEGKAGLENRSSRPRSAAADAAAFWKATAERLRRDYRLTGQEIAAKLKLARSTVAGWLTRMGLGRLAAMAPKEPVRRYQRERPGELLHLDIKKLARFDGVGHRITGDRRGRSQGMGYDFLHVAIDDATRLAYVEVLPDERRWSTTGFLLRALRWFRARGVRVERVMTDNGSGYVARLFRKVLRLLAIKHVRTRPYTPKTNGKAERFIQTMLREWAYAIPFPTSDRRAADLARWLAGYNERRPHASLAQRTPVQALAGTT
ncbi:IS481 family transposase [Rhodoblastus sp.]|jgi:transposase InsO family protein|uniref:IS481 family transposase n=1 Tax=Rhodoblastus sp. TaxID=1962975 RepID=UPI0025E20B32|nr:IS481 family transposase [Rhodoblastus sp.]